MTLVGLDEELPAFLSQDRSPLFAEWATLTGAEVVATNGSTTPAHTNPPATTTEGGGNDSDNEGDSDAEDDWVERSFTLIHVFLFEPNLR
jgi:hypothetical protein